MSDVLADTDVMAVVWTMVIVGAIWITVFVGLIWLARVLGRWLFPP